MTSTQILTRRSPHFAATAVLTWPEEKSGAGVERSARGEGMAGLRVEHESFGVEVGGREVVRLARGFADAEVDLLWGGSYT